MAKPETLDKTTLSVKDFGPIAEAAVELRPLTVFVGASNTGKSYLAILLYALHQFFRRRGPKWRGDGSIEDESSRKVTEWLGTLDVRSGQDRVDVTVPDEVAALVRPVLADVGGLAPLLDSEVGRCFGVADTKHLIRQSGSRSAQVSLQRRWSVGAQCVSYHLTIGRSQPQLRASIPASMPLRLQSVVRRSLRWVVLRHAANPSDLAEWVLPDVVGTVHSPIHYLPADRAGVMHAHRVVVRSLIASAPRGGLHVESPLPALSGVLADFLERLIALGDAKPTVRETTRLAESLEADILGGAVGVSRSPVGYPSFHYRPTNWKDDLALMNTSSMVSELAPVVLYLRHVVQPGDVLIIEEPESHLHPAMQVEFTRLLAAVVRAGVRVVVTTHSEWVLETLANLVRLSEVAKPQRKEVSPDGLVLRPDEVGAWLFERKKRPKGSVVKEIPLDVASGTFPAGFDEVTEALYNNWAGIANLVAERGA